MRRNTSELIKVGFWRSPTMSMYNHFPAVEDFIDPTWEQEFPDEHHAVVEYLQNADVTASYRGVSHCRVCKCSNGNKDHADDVYVWPQGFAHYVEAHSVRPPQDFINHVLGKL